MSRPFVAPQEIATRVSERLRSKSVSALARDLDISPRVLLAVVAGAPIMRGSLALLERQLLSEAERVGGQTL